jgi:hypothetical protein
MRHFFAPLVTALLVLAFATSLFARGQFWDFLGYTQVDAGHDHGRIQIVRRDRLFRTIQLRFSGEAMFLDRIVMHFGNGSSQELTVSERISPGGKDYVIDLPGERRALESVELWYYKEFWGHNPRVNLYGIRLPETGAEPIAPGH